MKRESMMKKSMHGLLRVALLAVMAMVFGVASFVSNADAAVAILSTATSGTSTTASVTFAHNNPGGTDTMIVVGAGMDGRDAETVSSVTYGGQALTCSSLYGTSDNRGSTVICYLLNPPTGNNNVVVTTSGNTSGKPRIGTAVVVSGAEQVAPAIIGVGGTVTTAILSGITSVGTDMVVGVINGYKADTTIAPSGSTEIIEDGVSGTNMANMAYSMGASSLTWNNATTSSQWGIGALVISEAVSCIETATVAAVDPGVITAATAITATLGGTGGSAPQVRWSTDGGAFSVWQASGATYTPPINSSGTVAIEAQATGFCGTITDSTPVNTTYDTLCVDPDPSTITIPVGQTAFGDGYDASLLITTTGDPAANLSLQYQVTQQQTTPGTPFAVGPVYQAGNAGGGDWPGETDIDTSYPATVSGTIDTIDVYLTTAVNGSILKFFTATISGTTVTPTNVISVTVNSSTAGDFQFTGLSLPIAAGEYLGAYGGSNGISQVTSADNMLYLTGTDGTGGQYTGNNYAASLNLHGSGTTAPTVGEVTCTNWTGTAAIPTTTAGGSLCGDYANGTYALYSRGTDPDCGTPIISSPVSQNFTWNSCTETLTLSAPTFSPSATPITSAVTVTAAGTAASIQVSWSEDGGTTWSPWVANGSIYNPTSCTIGNVIFRATGVGSCGVMNAQAASVAFDTNDIDLATLTITNPANAATIGGTVTIQVQVGVESAPATMTGMQTSINGGAWTNMNWNGTSNRWELSWDTTTVAGSDIAPVAQSVDVRGNDPDCGDAVIAPQINVSVDNTCSDTDLATLATTAPAAGNVSATVLIQTVVGVETSPDLMTNMTATIAGSTSCNGAFPMVWNGGNSRWEYSWDTALCGNPTEPGVTIDVNGNDPDCGTLVTAAQVAVTIDNTFDPLTTVGNVTATPRDASIDVSAPYTKDDNTNNTLLIEWGLNGVDFTLGNQALTNGPSPYTYQITGLTNQTSYQVRITFTDTDGVNGTNPTIILGLVPSNPMLHNAASTGSTRWGGTWGLAGGKYGEFTCDTCHNTTTTNIKRIANNIDAPDTADDFPSGNNAPALLSDVRDGTSDYADPNIAHTTSAQVCEVCHTYDAAQTNGVKHHAYDMSGASAINQDHYAGQDCMSCHNHKEGFLPTACDACHGNPPVVNTLGGPTGLADTPVTTGSTTAGAHNRHVNTEAFACENCHNGYVMPNGGDINIAFSNFSVTTGNYTGQSGVSYNGSLGTGTLTCSSVYCHGSTISAPASPVWTGAVSCGDCHGAAFATPPNSVSHSTHVGSLNRQCSDCHGVGYTAATVAPAGHMNGTVHVDVTAAPNTGATATYNGATSSDLGLAPANVDATCANISCHFGSTPNWDTAGSTNCASCHNSNGAGAGGTEPWPFSGGHDAHFAALGVSLAAQVGNEAAVRAECDRCHTGTSGSHADGVKDVSISATYNAQSGTAAFAGNQCSSVSCHGGKITPSWATGTINVDTQCDSCHKWQAVATEYNSATSGMHGITTAVSGQTHVLSVNDCANCHAAQPSLHFTGLDTPATDPVDNLVAGITLGATPDLDTCTMTCHLEGADANRGTSTPWARLNNKTWASGGGAAGDECNTCHGTWGAWRGNVLVDHTADWDGDGTPEVQANHSECETCHGFAPTSTNANYNATWGTGDHGNGNITMNGPTPNTGAGYNQTNWGCDNACHGGAASGHNLSDSTWTVGFGDFGAGSCDNCHSAGGSGPEVVWPLGNSGFTGDGFGSHMKATLGDVIDGATDWTVQCQKCHGFHTGDSGLIPNNTAVGINYTTHGGIYIGGTATTSTTEAEICWECHSLQGVDEFGVNNNVNTGGLSYDYGSLSTSNWTTATWTSGTAAFGYKTGAIQSTHSVNSAGTAAVTGTPYSAGGMSETKDAVANIRCTYCHDVHNRNVATGDTLTGQPFLRGNWKGNPYNEDGAPLTAFDGNWTQGGGGTYGLVPRGSASPTNNGGVGGYWIDQNSGNPNSGETLSSVAGLCTLCHGTNVDAMDQTTGENLWVGTNGHSSAVIGGTGSAAVNIFTRTNRGQSALTVDPGSNSTRVDMGLYSENNRGYAYRGQVGLNYTPNTNPAYRGYAFKNFEWGSSAGGSTAQIATGTMELIPDDGTQNQAQFHTFNCGKCHNPHASRLPKLMITNCLDNNHNTWQDGYQTDGSGGASNGEHLSNWFSAQNCHRRGPAEATGATGSGTAFGPGWNKVTPW